MTVFYFLFYFYRMQTHETVNTSATVIAASHLLRFNSARDARNRKVRGLWKRGERYYLQTRVPGEKSARKIPLAATSLTEAKEEMAKQRIKAREGSLPKGGVKPSLRHLEEHTWRLNTSVPERQIIFGTVQHSN